MLFDKRNIFFRVSICPPEAAAGGFLVTHSDAGVGGDNILPVMWILSCRFSLSPPYPSPLSMAHRTLTFPGEIHRQPLALHWPHAPLLSFHVCISLLISPLSSVLIYPLSSFASISLPVWLLLSLFHSLLSSKPLVSPKRTAHSNWVHRGIKTWVSQGQGKVSLYSIFHSIPKCFTKKKNIQSISATETHCKMTQENSNTTARIE